MDKQELKRQVKLNSKLHNTQKWLPAFIDVPVMCDLIDQLDEPEITELDALNRLAEKVPLSADDIARHLAKLSAYNGKVTYGYNEPETLSQNWISDHTIFNEKEDAEYVYADKLQNLLVPKQGEIKVPQEWFDIIKMYKKNDANLWMALYEEDIVSDKSDDFARAWLAYPNIEVEKEKKYEVKDKNDCFLLTKNSEGEVINAYSKVIYKNKGQLTEKEIKDYDERFWPFAEEVES